MAASSDVEALVQRLRSRRATAQAQAAAALSRQADCSPPDCDAFAAAGAVPLLVQLLRSSSAVVQEQAATALQALTADSASAREAVQAAGGLQALVALLHSRSSSVQEHAAAALANTAYCEEFRAAIAAAGAVPPLVQLCAAGRAPAVRETAATALNNLSLSAGLRDALAAAGATEVLVSLMRGSCSRSSGSLSDAAAPSARALSNLASQRPDLKVAIAAAGGAAALVQLLSSNEEEGQQAAANALLALASGRQPGVCAAIAAAGGIAALAARLASSSSGGGELMQARVIRTLTELAEDSEERCAAISEAGCIPHLVRLVGAAGEVLVGAAGALQNLTGSGGTGEVRAAVVAAGGIRAMAALLRSGGSEAVLEPAVFTLLNLLSGGHGPAIAASGVLPALERLRSSPNRLVGKAADIVVYSLSSAALGAAPGTPAASRRQRPPRVCAAPGCAATATLRRCGGCGAVRYCGEACSKAHWHAHKAECRRLQAERAAEGSAGAGGSGQGARQL